MIALTFSAGSDLLCSFILFSSAFEKSSRGCSEIGLSNRIVGLDGVLFSRFSVEQNVNKSKKRVIEKKAFIRPFILIWQ